MTACTEDTYYNGMYTRQGVIVVDHHIGHLSPDSAGETAPELDTDAQMCFTANAATTGFRQSARRLGFSVVYVGFVPVMSGVTTRLLSRPVFSRTDAVTETVRFRAITEVSKMRHAVSAVVSAVEVDVRHEQDTGWHISEHRLVVEQVYTEVEGTRIHHLDGVRARNAVAYHDLYSVADAAALSVFVRLDRHVLTPVAVDRHAVDTSCKAVF